MLARRCIGFFLLSLLLSSSHALAQKISVDIAATVTYVDDPYGIIKDIKPGQSLDGLYQYSTKTPDQDATKGAGHFLHSFGEGLINLNSGSYRFKTQRTAPAPLEIHVVDEAWVAGEEAYHVSSFDNEVTNGADIFNIALDLYSNQGSNAFDSESLSNTPPNPILFNKNNGIMISGQKDGYQFSIEAKLNALTKKAPLAVKTTSFTYKAIARVNYISDSHYKFNNKLRKGDLIEASYTVDSTTEGMIDLNETTYTHAPDKGTVSVNFSGIVLSNKKNSSPNARIMNGPDMGYDHFHISSKQIQSNLDTLSPGFIQFLFNGAGSTLSDNRLITKGNKLSLWRLKKLFISSAPDQNWFINADIIELTLLSEPSLDIAQQQAPTFAGNEVF